MRLLCLATLLALSAEPTIQGWMEHAFYPVLLLLLLAGSFGVPIPEDIPLIAAGVLLNTHPGIATWHGTLPIALVGVLGGDMVLYSLGRRWGPEVVSHRYVRRLIRPQRYQRLAREFNRHGVWVCFAARFFMGLRAAMCLTAGATRFPGWKFFLADLCGAVLSVPFFVWLGYWFVDMIPTLRVYLTGVQWALLAGLLAGVALYARHVIRKRQGRRERLAERLRSRAAGAGSRVSRRSEVSLMDAAARVGSLDEAQASPSSPQPGGAKVPAGRPPPETEREPASTLAE